MDRRIALMKKHAVRELEKVLIDDIRNFKNMSLTDPDKAKALQSIGKENTIILADDKEKSEKKAKEKQSILEEKRFDLELEKFKREEQTKTKQFELDERKFELEKAKFNHDLENSRIQNEIAIKKMESESKNAQIQIYISIAGIVGTFLLGLIGKLMYVGLASNAQKHEYNDYQLEPMSSKENRQNLLK